MKALVTGGCGFIGGAIVRRLLGQGASVVNLDKLSYAATPESLDDWRDCSRYQLVVGDICDAPLVTRLFEETAPDVVIHCAAETHVDRSIDGPAAFLASNVTGTFCMLEAARTWWSGRKGGHRFHHISTDEVYGSLGPRDPAFTEATAYAPSSPYAASKAAADHLVRAWGRTYGLPVVVTNCSNNYGPWQFPEKLIPLMILNGIEGKPLPIYGTGRNIRDWLHVDDHATAVLAVLERGTEGETYNVGGDCEVANLAVVNIICAALDRHFPDAAPHERLVRHVTDRAGHDARYAVDTARLRRELRWRPARNFAEGLAETVEWYLAHRDWWQAIRQTRYDGARLGRVAERADAPRDEKVLSPVE